MIVPAHIRQLKKDEDTGGSPIPKTATGTLLLLIILFKINPTSPAHSFEPLPDDIFSSGENDLATDPFKINSGVKAKNASVPKDP